MSYALYSYGDFQIAPGAKERIEERLKQLPEINKNRPCKKCIYYNPDCLIRCRANLSCNFNHDRFVEITYDESDI